MEGSLSSIFRFRDERLSGVIYHFDLVIVTKGGKNSALVGDCLVNISNGNMSMRLDSMLPCSEAQKSNFMDDIFNLANSIEEEIYA